MTELEQAIDKIEDLYRQLYKAEAERDKLRQFAQHRIDCASTNMFKRTRPKCNRCFGTGYIPSETCQDCVDCQDSCPECGHLDSVNAPCDCGLAALLTGEASK